MRVRSLGATTTSAIGCTASLAVSAARGVDAGELARALHAAFGLGVALVDVAPEPDTERLVGDAVRAERIRDRAIVATHVVALAARGPLHERLPPRHVQDRVEASLRATKLDALPLVQLQLPADAPSTRAWPELAGTCARLVREGKVLQWSLVAEPPFDAYAPAADEAPAPPPDPLAGVGGADLAELLAREAVAGGGASLLALAARAPAAGGGLLVSLADLAPPPAPSTPAATNEPRAAFADDTWLVAIAAPLSLCDRRAAPLLGGKLPVLATSPLGGGILGGAIGPAAALRVTDDRRAALAPARLERIAVAMARLAPFVRREPVAARSCEAGRAILDVAPPRERDPEAFTVAELALRRLVDRGAIPLPRLHRADHVAEAVAAANAPPLSPWLHEQLDGLDLDN